MRKLTLRAVPVCLLVVATGCFSTGGLFSSNAPPATPTPTTAYWQKVSVTLAIKPTGGDMKSMVQLIRTQTEQLRTLSPDGVDAELVAAVNEVVKCEDEVLRRAQLVGNDPEILRKSKEMATVFADANRKAADAKKRLRAMRTTLNSRYGGGFSPISG